jgi:hypothetical protein
MALEAVGLSPNPSPWQPPRSLAACLGSAISWLKGHHCDFRAPEGYSIREKATVPDERGVVGYEQGVRENERIRWGPTSRKRDFRNGSMGLVIPSQLDLGTFLEL